MVRGISGSVARSRYVLSTFGAATMTPVQAGAREVVGGRGPGGGSNSPMAVVNTTSAVIRGLASAIRSEAVALTPRLQGREERNPAPASSQAARHGQRAAARRRADGR